MAGWGWGDKDGGGGRGVTPMVCLDSAATGLQSSAGEEQPG